MNGPSSTRVISFIVVFAIIAILINLTGSQSNSDRAKNATLAPQKNLPDATPPAPVSPQNLPPATTPPPPPISPQPVQIVHPQIWPDDVPATQIVHIPDPEHPTTGIMDYTLHPGNELEMDLEPLWLFDNSDINPSVEWVVKNDGDNFESVDNYLRDNPGNSWWTKRRIARFHLRPGVFGQTTFRITVVKKSDDLVKPLPKVPPQQIGNLLVSFKAIRGLQNGQIILNLEFQNLNLSQSIGVAMYGDVCHVEPCEVLSKLVASDGALFGLSSGGLAGILSMRTIPRKLTEIQPNGRIIASLTFYPQSGVLRSDVTSFTFQTQIVIDPNYSSYQLSNYHQTQDLPAFCTVANMNFDIPVRGNN